MKKLILAVSLLATLGTLSARNTFFERAVKIKTDEKDAVRVYETGSKTEVLGNYSVTTIEYLIENKTNRIMEGEFEFPLLDGENVAGFALDIDGKMRKAVAVEKEKGRQIFESIVRRGLDPGLVEKTEGNNFKTRVYPIPPMGVRHITVTVEKEIPADEETAGQVFTQTMGKDTYFYFYEPVQAKKEKKPKTVSSITVLFDVSSSAKNRDLEKEIDFLKKYVSSIQQEGVEENGPEVTVITFSNEIRQVNTFGLNAASLDGMEAFLKNQIYDGATSYDFNLSKVSSDEILLFSDGLENWSDRENRNWKTSVPVHTVCSASSANFSFLKNLANENNGFYINLSNTEIDAAVSKLKKNPLRVLKVECNDQEITGVFPKKGSTVEDGITVTGILKKKEGKIKITLGRNGKAETVIEKTVSAVDSSDSEFVSRLWAMKKLEILEEDKDANKNEIAALAKKFTIVTDDMSLIVLESARDYIRYGLELPEDLKDVHTSSLNLKMPVDNMKAVYRMFESFKQWWNSKPGEYPPKPTLRTTGNGIISSGRANTATASVRATASSRASEAVSDSWDEEADEGGMPLNSNADNATDQTTGVVIALQTWDSEADYISVLKKTATEKMYEKYLELKKTYEKSPAFYMEVSDYFAEENLLVESERILSNMAEISLNNTDILRALGNKLVERKDYRRAAIIFDRLTKIRGDIPQFYRDYALACNMMGEKQKAVDALWKIVTGTWENRFSETQITALNDMNAIIAAAEPDSLDLSRINKDLMVNFDTDIRIVLTWNTDECDIDLWVTDPDNEKCFYGNKYTAAGARMSRDFTWGYGPEEFMIRNAPKGKYKIEVNYYGSHKQKLLQPVVVQAEVYTNWGRPNQQRQVLTLQLDDIKQTFFIGEIEF